MYNYYYILECDISTISVKYENLVYLSYVIYNFIIINTNFQTNKPIVLDRGVSITKVYNSMPQKNQFGETHYKDTLPNEPLADRINPDILDAFRKNPYTQSLHSYVFQ